MKTCIALLAKVACFLELLRPLLLPASFLFRPKNNHQTFVVGSAGLFVGRLLA